MKRHISLALTSFLLLSTINLTACANNSSTQTRDENVLRIASWDEYIDMGGEDSYYSADARPLYEEFEDWYKETYGKTIKVEYVALQDNETMYGKIKMGDSYDLLCPSEYMIMKLATENKLKPFPESFFDTTLEHNYFAKNLSCWNMVFDIGTVVRLPPPVRKGKTFFRRGIMSIVLDRMAYRIFLIAYIDFIIE